MAFRTTWNIPPYDFQIANEDGVVLLGSCFSDNIGTKLNYFGFHALINPFGTIFHPLALAKLLQQNYQPEVARTVARDGQFFHLDAHSKLSAANETAILEKLRIGHAELHQYLSTCKLLVITLGTAWGYYKDNQIVANCQKLPQSIFEKKLSDLTEMRTIWQKTLAALKSEYPKLHILFTVSPVRHTKDGFIENQLSKARLLELVHSLNAPYFPAYELMMDDLRDYRFYERDMIHPNQQAIDYIFERFEQSIMLKSTQEKNQKIHKFRLLEQHKILSKVPEQIKAHQEKVEEMRKLLGIK
jgi:hypothetical protein